MSSKGSVSSKPSIVEQQYRVIHTIYVLLDDGDRRTLRAFDLTNAQYDILAQLDAERGRRLTVLSRNLLRSKSSITRTVDQLENAGLVQRQNDPHDRRAQFLVLTPAGAERRDQARKVHLCSLERRFSSLSETEQQQLHVLLNKLSEGLSARLEIEKASHEQ